jgi:hypothetical protein
MFYFCKQHSRDLLRRPHVSKFVSFFSIFYLERRQPFHKNKKLPDDDDDDDDNNLLDYVSLYVYWPPFSAFLSFFCDDLFSLRNFLHIMSNKL